MTAVVSDRFRVKNAADFVATVGNSSNSFYMFMGKVTAWPSPDSDGSPPTPTDTVNEIDIADWRDMIGAKRVISSNVKQAIPRYDWTTSTVYDQYSSTDANLFDKDFFVLTSDYNVYKCLENNGGAASTTMPTGTGSAVITTADGYRWKYMYTVSATESENFLTNQHVPVHETASNALSEGTIESYNIVSGGSGYTNGSYPITVSGDGSGAAGTATVSGGVITKVVVSAAGSGYTQATVTLSGAGAGTGVSITANIAPPGGHGANNAMELAAHYVIMNTKFEYGEASTLTTENDFRKIGILRDPYNYGTTTVATATNIRQTTRFTLTSVSGTFTGDETITASGGKSAHVVEWDSINSYLYVSGIIGTFATTNVLTGGTSGATGTINTINNPGFKPYSGSILYVEHRSPVFRDTDQIEDMRVTLEF